MTDLNKLPFRMGTTSYIVPDEILPNVRYLAGKVRDVELVLFEVDDGLNNIPSPVVIEELKRLAQEHDLTYTVHLPLDLKLGSQGAEQDVSLRKARRVIEDTRDLDAWAYVAHLDGRSVLGEQNPAVLAVWQDQALRALDLAAGWIGDPLRLAVENLERYSLDFLEPIMARSPVSRCVDIGHLWLDGAMVKPYLDQALPRTRVIYLHGISGRDHQSLVHISEQDLDEVMHALCEANYCGVVTMEVFSEENFIGSLKALNDSLNRLGEV